MAIKFKIDMKKEEKTILDKLVKGVDGAVNNAKKYLDSITPEDTGNLLKNNKIERAKIIGGSVQGKLYNDTEYALYVEYGVGGNKYVYHKPKGTPFYRGVGNRTFARTADDTEKQTLLLIKQSLG